jgi:hypothetical protein
MFNAGKHFVCIELDPSNPGQFFACCGLFDLLARQNPEVLASFVLDPKRPRFGKFRLEGIQESDVTSTLQIVKGARYCILPVEENLRAVAPIQAKTALSLIQLDWWLKVFQDGSTALKGWGGQVTSLKLFQDLITLIPATIPPEGLFQFARPTSSRFGVDPRSAWNSIDLGYSPNEQGQEADSFPVVEILSSFGLQSFRPIIGKLRSVRYFLWTTGLPAGPARLAAFAPWNGLAGQSMLFHIEGRGQSYKYFSFASPYSTTSAESNSTFIMNTTEEDN